MKNGVPFNLAFGNVDSLQPIEMEALAIIFQEIEGAKFNWQSLKFEDAK